jgi:hypothetical protein
MTIHITNCSTGTPIVLASVTDIYGDVSNTDSYGNIQVTPGYEGALYGTLISVSAYTFLTQEFTISSYDVNNFCLKPAPTTGTGTGTGGLY